MIRSKISSALGALVLLSLVGCSPQPMDFKGSISIPTEAWDGDGDPQEAGDLCLLETDYPDVDLGTQVTLRDSSGATVALSQLGQGLLSGGWYPDGKSTFLGDNSAFVEDKCVYSFTFSGVESGDDFFSIEVGSRGEVQFSREQLEASTVFLTLG